MILSELLLRSHDDVQGGEVREISKAIFLTFIRDYLLDEENHFRTLPTSTADLDLLLKGLKPKLAERLLNLYAQHWPAEVAELASRSFIEQTIEETGNALAVVIQRLHRRLTWARTTRSELHRKKDTGLIEREEEQLLRRCDEFVINIVKSDRSTYTLTVLATEGFLPGYGVYEGGITASARRDAARFGPRTFDLSRSNVVALREFVPGNRLYANRGSFYVSRYHLGADETARIRTLRVNPKKGFVTEESGDVSYGQSGGVPIDALPLTDLDLTHESRITEDESLRFSMPVSVLGRLRKRNRGGTAYKVGTHEVSHVRGQGIELVNLGEAARVKADELEHLICSVCGAAKTPYAVTEEIAQFLRIHRERCGKEPTRLALSVNAEVDLLQFHNVSDEAKAMNLGEAIRAGAARLLDMGQDDLQLLVIKKPDDKLDLLLYDPMPGGSCLLEQILNRWRELVAAARDVLTGCKQGCDTACYSCLKTFRNQFHHEMLNRHKALESLEEFGHVPDGYRQITPVFDEEKNGEGNPSNKPEAILRRLLLEHHFPEGVCRKRIVTTAGLPTEPDWVYEPSKTAVYLDGMSRSLHGDPKTAQRDQLIRQMLELDGYTVIVVQSRDLNDPQAVRQHLKNVATAIGRTDLADRGFDRSAPAITEGEVSLSEVDQLLRYADERCHSFLKSLTGKNKTLPEIGFELVGDDGDVVAQAELAWPEKKVALILADQHDQTPGFAKQGWTVVTETDLVEAGLLEKLLGE